MCIPLFLIFSILVLYDKKVSRRRDEQVRHDIGRLDFLFKSNIYDYYQKTINSVRCFLNFFAFFPSFFLIVGFIYVNRL